MTDVVIVDAGLGNLRSVEKSVVRAAAECGKPNLHVEHSSDPDVIRKAARIVVPGQGGFRDCARVFAGDLGEAVREQLDRGTPYFGICLGLQVLFESSEEAPGEGLGWFEGHVARLQGAPATDDSAAIKVPHMGWNQLQIPGELHPYLSKAGGAGSWFYFVHSFHAVPKDPSVVVAHVDYGPNHVTAAVARDHVFATQFHPEKSQAAGLQLLEAFLAA